MFIATGMQYGAPAELVGDALPLLGLHGITYQRKLNENYLLATLGFHQTPFQNRPRHVRQRERMCH